MKNRVIQSVKKDSVLLAVVLIFTLLFSGPSYAQNKVFRAGASLSNITPPLGLEIVGNYNRPQANYIHDQLHVKTVVLDDGNETLVFAIVDNVGVKREVYDAAKAIIENKLKIPASHVMIAATHTHSAVSAGKQGMERRGWQYGEPLDAYQLFVAKRIADGVQTALANLEPARIAWGSVDVPEHVFNRRWIMKNEVWSPLGFKDKAKMNPGVAHPNLDKPAGPTDPEVSFLAVETLEGQPISVIGNYSLHYVGGVPSGHISADYFAIFGDRIQQLLEADRQDPPFVGILTNGTSGDINNINWPGPRGERYPAYGKMRYVANDVAEKVFGVYQSLDFQEWVPLGAAASELTLDIRRASPELLANMEKVRKRPDDDKPLYHSLEKIYAERIRIHEEEWPDEIDIVLQTFKIGDLGIAAIPFEVFAETGLEIKEKSPFADAFTIELANGSYGYLPTPEQHEVGGYETWLTTNKVQKDASRLIVSELMDLFGHIE
ncbi:neutral/alkaline non-lysosomal ceramidase N-terminal domain-containing protein [Membranicola marinus]|uniref:Neutral/alkaline non-lysosomal ceramidase N-terminal domain-containing protein n=1 Tax=Membranihabitans marinus TaxID=1227546 RepID=A0A953L8C3_9BACT|nr:neutral/alkaline non-lysosomal ceramidase N-terminal domain-containing protein [Membranihabitans marinus]MBY5959667.1 neutral/alkaline non-lysosomal ceramidase N-terminal domain-containing protein [Membranihabitans marinus]